MEIRSFERERDARLCIRWHSLAALRGLLGACESARDGTIPNPCMFSQLIKPACVDFSHEMRKESICNFRLQL